jgi:hypothetical protein
LTAFGLDSANDSTADWLLTARLRHDLSAALDAFRRQTDVIRLDCRPQHGDFAGRNIMVTERGIIVLDMTHNREAPTVADIAYFGVALRLLIAQYQCPAILETTLLDAFRTGYQHASGQILLDVLHLKCTNLCRWRGTRCGTNGDSPNFRDL